MKWTHLERTSLLGTRLLALVPVWASFAGAVLMFFIGTTKVIDAFFVFLGHRGADYDPLPSEEAIVILVIESLDLFLIGIVLMYFSYGVYALFVRPQLVPEASSLPPWLKVRKIGQLKQVIAEVILVVLFVLFLRVALQTFHRDFLTLAPTGVAAVLALPVSIMLLALALRLAELHPKPEARADGEDGQEPGC